MRRSRILSVGMYLPEREVTNAELEAMESDPQRSPLAKRVREVIVSIEETLQVLFSDFNYALLRAKLMAEMVIGVIAATELLKQAGADPSRLDLAHAFVQRRMPEAETKARRIVENVEGRLEQDARLLEQIAPSA